MADGTPKTASAGKRPGLAQRVSSMVLGVKGSARGKKEEKQADSPVARLKPLLVSLLSIRYLDDPLISYPNRLLPS